MASDELKVKGVESSVAAATHRYAAYNPFQTAFGDAREEQKSTRGKRARGKKCLPKEGARVKQAFGGVHYVPAAAKVAASESEGESHKGHVVDRKL